MDIHTVLKQDFVNALIGNVCGADTSLVIRENSYAVRKQIEGERDIHRVILLPPRGFTANEIDQMNSHDEAAYATIEIKGAIKDGKRGFSRLKDCLLVAAKNENGAVSSLNQPYLTFDIDNPDQQLSLQKRSAGEAPFAVVKADGSGFYHNLINLTDEWLALKLHKQLRPQRTADLTPILDKLPQSSAKPLELLYHAISQNGDRVFQTNPAAINEVLNLPTRHSLPALGEMLHIHDSGMHEACTVFAIVLKIGKAHQDDTINYLEGAIEKQSVPTYYAEQLIGKLQKPPPSALQKVKYFLDTPYSYWC